MLLRDRLALVLRRLRSGEDGERPWRLRAEARVLLFLLAFYGERRTPREAPAPLPPTPIEALPFATEPARPPRDPAALARALQDLHDVNEGARREELTRLLREACPPSSPHPPLRRRRRRRRTRTAGITEWVALAHLVAGLATLFVSIRHFPEAAGGLLVGLWLVGCGAFIAKVWVEPLDVPPPLRYVPPGQAARLRRIADLQRTLSP